MIAGDSYVLVTGGSGFLGSYVVKLLEEKGYDVVIPLSKNYDLVDPDSAYYIFGDYGTPYAVINLAADVGGIGYNQSNAYTLFYNNAMMSLNLIEASIQAGVKKFVQIGTTCSYPKHCPVPFRIQNLFSGYPEETNAPYGLAKLMSYVQLKAARQQFGFNGIYLIPTNLYGPGDNFDLQSSHVIPALIRKFIEAQETGKEYVEIWGTGKASRDFLFVTDAAQAIVKALEDYDNEPPLNIGSGEEITIHNLVYIIQNLIGYDGTLLWDVTKPDGQPKRALYMLDTKRILKWAPSVCLEEGLKLTIDWYKENR